MPTLAATAGKKETHSRLNKAMFRSFLKLCILADTPFSLACYHKCKEGEFQALASLEFDPFFYSWNARYEDFDLDYQIAIFFRSYQGLRLGIDREETAFRKWETTEVSCRATNQYFRRRWEGRVKPYPFHVEEVYHLARRKISSILGTVKGHDLDTIRQGAHHGPGGDLSLPKRHASGYRKFLTPGDITQLALRAYDVIYDNDGNDSSGLDGSSTIADIVNGAEIVDSSKLTFVPKTSQIDRAICIEPRWNVFLQLGVGSLITQRLRRCGLTLNDQVPNQEAARTAWVSGHSTLDLSSASDTVALNLVADLLQFADPIWWDLIKALRCPATIYRGRRIVLEKISSMGNGYTFPLESLIFYAFAWAVCRFNRLDTRSIRVFGDDIIVPQAAASHLIEVLQTFGFLVNTRKSFVNGDFFESCGCDYFRGREVRPFIHKDDDSTLLGLYSAYNKVIAWSKVEGPCGPIYNRQRMELAKPFLDLIPGPQRLWGPTSLSGVLHSAFDVWGRFAKPIKDDFATCGWEGFVISAWQPLPKSYLGKDYFAHVFSKLSGVTSSGNRYVVPGSSGMLVGKVIVPFIEDFVLD